MSSFVRFPTAHFLVYKQQKSEEKDDNERNFKGKSKAVEEGHCYTSSCRAEALILVLASLMIAY